MMNHFWTGQSQCVADNLHKWRIASSDKW